MTVLGTPEADLYDLTEDGGGYEEGVLVDAARTRYQKVVGDLREQILSGKPQPGEYLDSQAKLSATARTDSALINRALSVLRAEGLIRVEHGRKTIVLERSLWLVEFRFTASEVPAALTAAAAGQPAVRSTSITEDQGVKVITLAVESADLPGAVTVALSVARDGLGSLPILSMTSREA
ncbi:MAG TPA: GntR family transcriptional regulator [Streptosporangiaceae bacterium]|nr:GntR family transcriptional regulator [Streptosporangiaceae bacterium]